MNYLESLKVAFLKRWASPTVCRREELPIPGQRPVYWQPFSRDPIVEDIGRGTWRQDGDAGRHD
jgi:hypothetical protein